ncbi:DEAD/DEAH box helicase [Planomicrobium sp. CPCC 101079]|uniref:DEAD/DEAH box helicase n=1 Tax=Planomicrobium sp. CPCC 101079 TaxID=2599618 RepID=UPI0011B464A7|nr:DEAD/DEAH box helicase [Planomicrobium sp. CPCC 101079]TWT00529.1 DEAD/DEAH box helicase [Planomicrobium sp. CPCC 101079]
MNFSLNEGKIKKLCGTAAYKKGLNLQLAGKVAILMDAADELLVKGTVKGRTEFHVSVKQTPTGEILASCSCPPVGFVATYCHHIAGVLLAIDEWQQRENPIAAKMMDLFGEQQFSRGNRLYFDKRQLVQVEFSCCPLPFEENQAVLGIKLKAGIEKLEDIANVKEFLTRIGQGEAYTISKDFVYTPKTCSLDGRTDNVLQFLIKSQLLKNKGEFEPDLLVVSPSDWERLLPLLQQVPLVKVVQGRRIFRGLHLAKALPLTFRFDEAGTGGYRLDVEGLDGIMVLPAYDMAFSDGSVIRLSEEDTNRLARLKEMMAGTENRLAISADKLNHFMETVTPGLERLGIVQLTDPVEERLEMAPLQARVYLDRLKHRLLAGVEFHYGHLVINPCEEAEEGFRQYPGIRRQRDKEQQILRIMEESGFAQTDGGYYMHDEEAEYQFLYHAVPVLEKLVQVYATTAVKLRVTKAYAGPKIKVEISERTDWLEFKFDLQEIPEAEIKKILAALQEKRKYYRIPNGTLMSLETPEFLALSDFIYNFGITEENFGEHDIRVPLIHGMQFAESLEEGQLMEPGKAFAGLLKSLSQPEQIEQDVPAHLAETLRDYQKAGLNWFKMLAKYKFGGILADDMGLGKTLQSIAFIVSVLPDIRVRKSPVLIVAPSSLVYNWLNELKKFAPEVNAAVIDGQKAKRAALFAQSAGLDVIITSYPALRMDSVMYRNKSFHTVFFDEAQAFKNPATQTAKAAKAIQAEYRFALTGTPIENSLDELWSIFYVVFPELLPNRRAFSEMRRERITKRVRPFILRRVKQDVLKELPSKVETILRSELQMEQKKLYAAYLAELKQDALKHLNKDSFQKNRIRILAGLTRLRQLCCHPALFVEGYSGGSAKLDQLMDILEECRVSGRRVLVFSQFTQMLGIIGGKLAKRGVPYFYLDGQTPPIERVEMCSRFNEGEGNLFLISLKAGGTGLNLTGADTVILYDLWWNPAIEQQAADRAHRMGQKNEVQVIRLVAKGTIEEKITQLQERKKNLIDEVIQSGVEPLAALTEEDIREILTV